MFDPIVAEIRKIRNAHSKKFNYDVALIVKDYQNRSIKIRQRLNNKKKDFNKAIST